METTNDAADTTMADATAGTDHHGDGSGNPTGGNGSSASEGNTGGASDDGEASTGTSGTCQAPVAVPPRPDDLLPAQILPPEQLFVLSEDERALFTPPYAVEWGTNFEDFPLQRLWDAFNTGVAPEPLDPTTSQNSWYEPFSGGSQNHALLWIGESALAYALRGDADGYDVAAANAIKLLDLDATEGHMRQEGISGYAGFWEGGIAAFALAGYYAPAGSTHGEELLAKARTWWADHIAVLRTLRMPDGQLGLIGSRTGGGEDGDPDDGNLRPAAHLQLMDPYPRGGLHPRISALLDASGQPLHGSGGTHQLHWWKPRLVGRWLVLRALQSGALERAAADRPTPYINRTVYRWDAGGRTHIATPRCIGLPRCRYHVSWAAAEEWVRIEVADPNGTTGGKGLPDGHLPPVPVNIPQSATQVLGDAGQSTGSRSGGVDLALIAIEHPADVECASQIYPEVTVQNMGSDAITDLSLYVQVDDRTLYQHARAGATHTVVFSPETGEAIAPGDTRTLSLDYQELGAGMHTLRVWVRDVNFMVDPSASNNEVSKTFEVLSE